MDRNLSKAAIKKIKGFQRDEINGALIYRRLAAREKNEENRKILLKMASDETEHAAVWRSYTGLEISASRLRVGWLSFLGLLMGFTFVLRLLERSESEAQRGYAAVVDELPEAGLIMQQEHAHEQELIEMLDEERLHYVGSMVLGLNDALVELTGTIAGLSFALANTRLVALSGIITGVSATLSMAASNYLAERANDNPNALKSSLYTGLAYLVTVAVLVLPFLLLPNDGYLAALVIMLAAVLLIIVFFNFYISVAKNESFWKRFGEMAIISLSVAAISFVIGLLVKKFLGIDI